MTNTMDNEYEQIRAQRMSRNADMLKQLKVERIATTLKASARSSIAPCVDGKGQARVSFPRKKRGRYSYSKAAHANIVVGMRKSRRIRGEKAGEGELENDNPNVEGQRISDVVQPTYLEIEEYFKMNNIKIEPIKCDGRFNGWVCEDICFRYGIARNATEAWEEHGGGKFSFKISKLDIPTHLKSRGWSDARAFSSTQMLKNPNAYFYRHVAPHEAQAYGEWTQEEHELFLETARKFGVGDKWGLFSSYIPRRVGYQCSAYYREEIIPRGLILDPRFKMTASGRALYIG